MSLLNTLSPDLQTDTGSHGFKSTKLKVSNDITHANYIKNIVDIMVDK